MESIKLWIVLHIILGPVGVFMMMDDAKHPERWGDWWRNPTYAVPFCVAMEVIIAVVLVLDWRRERKRVKSRSLLEESGRLHEQGEFDAAEVVFQKWRRLYGND